MAYTHIKPGEEIEISSRLYHSSVQEIERLSDLVKLTFHELEQRKIASEEAEKVIFSKFDPIVSEWQQQAHETVLLREALEYLRTSVPSHTSNRWKEDEHGRHEMSNMVYTFSWRLYERTVYSHARQKSETVAWVLTWSIYFNTPRNPDNIRTGWKIAGQEQKVFGTREEMDKYLQGRINAYSRLFTEISPPIPKGEEGRFSVNGVLLPGYTVEVPEATFEEQVENLLVFAEDGDIETAMPVSPQPQPPAPKAPTHKSKKHVPTR